MDNTTLVAIVGIAATASTALLGLGVQVVLALLSSARDSRRRRYEELLSVYREFGRSLSASTFAYNQMIEIDDAGELVGAKTKDEINARIEEDAQKFEPRHGRMMLRLQDASPRVLKAVSDWEAELDDLIEDSEPDIAVWWKAKLRAVERALAEYYVAAGEHARSQLLGPLRRVIANRKL